MMRQTNMNGRGNMAGQTNMGNQNSTANQTNTAGQSGMSQSSNAGSQSNAMSPQESTFKDYGSVPVIFDMDAMTKMNNTFRTILWTGEHMQLALMSLQPGEDIGVEMHPNTDQFLRIEEGDGIVEMGTDRDNLTFSQPIGDDDAVIIPAGSYHNISNTGDVPMKLYSIYAPPKHPYGTVHRTKADADAAEGNE